MLYLLVARKTSRIHYTAEILFHHLLNINYQILSVEDKAQLGNDACVINHSKESVTNALNIPDSGFLSANESNLKEPEVRFENDLAQLFPVDTTKAPDCHISFDLFAACFFLLSGYEYYNASHFDHHGRYAEKVLSSFRHNLHQEPWVHHYAQLLKEQLIAHFPGLSFSNPPTFDYEITFDIDRPWLFRHRSFLKNGVGMLKNLVLREQNLLKSRWNTLFSRQQDPYDTYETILNTCQPDKTRFFFLMRKGRLDNPLTPYNKGYQKLIHRIADAGFQIGIHPSYGAAEDRYLLWAEQFLLAHHTNQTIDAGRQHFLRHWLPETPHQYLEAGLYHDYGACFIIDAGFKYGMAQPFPWYDLRSETSTNLFIHPTMVMDRTLQQYLGLSPEDGLAYTKSFIEKTRNAGGKFVILLHNESLSNFGEWHGWRQAFLEVIHQLQKS